MSSKIFIGNFPKGLDQYRTAFFIDNNSFPTLYNFYSFCGRARKKRGTVLVGRLALQLNPSITLDGTGAYNLLTGLEASSALVQGAFSYSNGGITFTDDGKGNIVSSATMMNAGTINYATGALLIPSQAGNTLTGSYSYYPGLAVVGLEDFIATSFEYPLLLAFDKKYSYQISAGSGSGRFYATNYYKNPETAQVPSYYTGYISKTTSTTTSFTWSAPDSQQFWTTNYLGALWATNNSPGMQLQAINSVANVAMSTTKLTITVVNSPAIVGDFVWINEITGLTQSGTNSINNQAGYVIVQTGANPGTKTLTVEFPNANFVSDTYSGGIIQYLTNSVPGGGDGIRWYDGDPTARTGLPSTATGQGWVNFAPPLAAGSQSIENFNSGTYPFYLVGALAIVPFKDRLLFLSPQIQTSAQYLASVAPTILYDTVIWSWNGTPYYTASYDGNLPLAEVLYDSIITPGTGVMVTTVQGAGPFAYYTNQTGYGGYLSAGIDQEIFTVNNNEDVLLIGFSNKQTRFVYSGNDLNPFSFYLINSEYGSTSTFSTVTLDRGAITLGPKGIILTTQTGSQRIDLDIPNQIFTQSNQNNASLRVSGARDFQSEWVYFSYVPNTSTVVYPTQTFFYNYRDETWAIFYENFTTHGNYYIPVGGSGDYTWLTVPYTWDEPWISGEETALNQVVIGGTPEGYVLQKGVGTGEAVSGYISVIATYDAGNATQITSYNHCVSADNPLGVGDYLLLSGLLGPNASKLNGLVGQVTSVIDANNFVIDLAFPTGSTDYVGGGQFARLSQPLLQTKQFPLFWEESFSVRLGVQKYLFDATVNNAVTINIYLSQDPSDVWNSGNIVPALDSVNNALVYSSIVYTCPESTNIGLTPANINLQMPVATTPNSSVQQIWHRMNTSLIGNTFQIGVTLSDPQMRDPNNAQAEITLHAAILDVGRGPMLA